MKLKYFLITLIVFSLMACELLQDEDNQDDLAQKESSSSEIISFSSQDDDKDSSESKESSSADVRDTLSSEEEEGQSSEGEVSSETLMSSEVQTLSSSSDLVFDCLAICIDDIGTVEFQYENGDTAFVITSYEIIVRDFTGKVKVTNDSGSITLDLQAYQNSYLMDLRNLSLSSFIGEEMTLKVELDRSGEVTEEEFQIPIQKSEICGTICGVSKEKVVLTIKRDDGDDSEELEKVLNQYEEFKKLIQQDVGFRYDYSRSCFCPPEHIGPYAVTSFQDSVTSYEYIGPVLADLRDVWLDDKDLTIDALFQTLINALKGDADEVQYEFHSEYPIPVLISIDYIEEAVDDEVSYSIQNFVLDESGLEGDLGQVLKMYENFKELISDEVAFQYDYERSCFCPVEYLGPYAVTSFQDSVTSFEYTGPLFIDLDAVRLDEKELRIDTLFQILINALKGDVAELKYEFHKDYPIPTLVSIDQILEAADDEVSYSIKNLGVETK